MYIDQSGLFYTVKDDYNNIIYYGRLNDCCYVYRYLKRRNRKKITT